MGLSLKKLRTFKNSHQSKKNCDHPGCLLEGDFRAPKNRHLSSYYHFCLEHVQTYNKGWDYYAGMASQEIESDQDTDRTWRRPTWPLSGKQFLLNRMQTPLNLFGAKQEPRIPPKPTYSAQSPEGKALALFDLPHPPLQKKLREKYLVLVKKYHPDHHPDDEKAEKKLKEITLAYHILKKIAPLE